MRLPSQAIRGTFAPLAFNLALTPVKLIGHGLCDCASTGPGSGTRFPCRRMTQ